MNDPAPHYLLISGSDESSEPGRWRFMLRASDDSERFTAEDVEPEVRGERLELLAVVRGLEALNQPSRVTLVRPSRYVQVGIRSGISQWRRNGWQWEYFGRMVPVKNSDLWQRVDQAMRFHEVECRSLRFDPPHGVFPKPSAASRCAGEVRPAGTASDVVGTRVERQSVPDPCQRRRAFGESSAQSNRCDRRERSWRFEFGLGKMFSLVNLLRGNRIASLRPAAAGKEV